ncbi:Hypothetical protein SMAX5B_012026 [Scophthalmus maximus]|uniref:Ig-like domain-containing protein n=1 Tax=Scophthalmus maximus TaxID=52904 RepID=A0A2U9AX74_SCOMX|nr:Hypothetical protein SMAX5B_012026 [Scophthalmus maximus]
MKYRYFIRNVRPSTMMQKAFIFLLIFWNSSSFVSGNSTYQLEFLLGCEAVVPCQHTRSDSDSNSFKWFYKKDEHSHRIQIFFQDKQGLPHRHDFHPKRSVTHNRSLVISSFKEEDQGLYWCEKCYQDSCNTEQSTVIRVKKEILEEIQQTVYVTEGSSFEYECLGEFTNSKWSFEASNATARRISAVRMKTQNLWTSNKSIHIANVEGAHVGRYTCWTSRCGGQRHKLLTINLCVMTVHQSGDSSVSCDVICDLEFSRIKSYLKSNEGTGTTTISVGVDPKGSLNCSPKQIHDVYSKVNGTHKPSNASNKTTVFPDHPSCCGIDDRLKEENSVVYSSVIIGRTAKTSNNHIDCVYSEINV